MLATQHRLTSAQDFSAVMRRGSRAGTATVVAAVLIQPHAAGEAETTVSWRCGFIVSKAVGNAVQRHRTTRRLRHIVRDLIESERIVLPAAGRVDVVIRALSAAAEADHPSLTADVASGLRRATAKAAKRPQP